MTTVRALQAPGLLFSKKKTQQQQPSHNLFDRLGSDFWSFMAFWWMCLRTWKRFLKSLFFSSLRLTKASRRTGLADILTIEKGKQKYSDWDTRSRYSPDTVYSRLISVNLGLCLINNLFRTMNGRLGKWTELATTWVGAIESRRIGPNLRYSVLRRSLSRRQSSS